MREIVFDTETTGFDHDKDDRIVEVGCVELVNYLPTGKEFQIYINPGRAMGEGAMRVTGITNDMLKGKPSFSHPDVVDRLMEFFGDSIIVAHNAEFDRNFLNAELTRLGRATVPKDRFVDTVVLAREHRPGSPASLDAVCKRFNISLEGRELHGALKDARLLSMCYLELKGGRERAFDFAAKNNGAAAQAANIARAPRPTPLAPRIHAEEQAAHDAFVATLGEAAIWKKYA
ncbi:MAG TPA: DNA polymerase III subunit epsilon [Hyphomonadaceae bacterium]|jgi:DNA polymerase-3 subunit epsilon|nr:DNA polymerase III subunit epsilon [Hyphomonadaceae bacterium]